MSPWGSESRSEPPPERASLSSRTKSGSSATATSQPARWKRSSTIYNKDNSEQEVPELTAA